MGFVFSLKIADLCRIIQCGPGKGAFLYPRQNIRQDEAMKERTANNVHEAFVGEAKAYQRLLEFARKAEEEGFPQIAHKVSVFISTSAGQ